jgi:hypothetical protein
MIWKTRVSHWVQHLRCGDRAVVPDQRSDHPVPQHHQADGEGAQEVDIAVSGHRAILPYGSVVRGVKVEVVTNLELESPGYR